MACPWWDESDVGVFRPKDHKILDEEAMAKIPEQAKGNVFEQDLGISKSLEELKVQDKAENFNNKMMEDQKQPPEKDYQQGFGMGYEVGYEHGYEEGHDQGFEEGHDHGYEEGYDQGYKDGYDEYVEYDDYDHGHCGWIDSD